jgi:stress response protein YsnF
MANDPTSDSLAAQNIPIGEEELRLEKRENVTGRVRVRTVTEAVEEMADANVRTEDDVTIVPILEEVLVLRKQLVVREELHIRRRTSTESVRVPVTLRKQRAVVERLPTEGDASDPPTKRR